jgi:hypothetical protein
METRVTFMDCPSCGLPAEVEHRYTLTSTDGPLESAKIRCPHGHWFSGPVESLAGAATSADDAGEAAPASGGQREAAAGRPGAGDPRGTGTAGRNE